MKKTIIIMLLALILILTYIIFRDVQQAHKLKQINHINQETIDALGKLITHMSEQSRKLEGQVDSMTLVLKKIPNDKQIKMLYPVDSVGVNDSWQKIIRPISSAVDSISR